MSGNPNKVETTDEVSAILGRALRLKEEDLLDLVNALVGICRGRGLRLAETQAPTTPGGSSSGVGPNPKSDKGKAKVVAPKSVPNPFAPPVAAAAKKQAATAPPATTPATTPPPPKSAEKVIQAKPATATSSSSNEKSSKKRKGNDGISLVVISKEVAALLTSLGQLVVAYEKGDNAPPMVKALAGDSREETLAQIAGISQKIVELGGTPSNLPASLANDLAQFAALPESSGKITSAMERRAKRMEEARSKREASKGKKPPSDDSDMSDK